MAAYDFQANLNKQNLEEIFTLIDEDGSGTISSEELRKFLNLDSDSILLEEIMNEVDSNNDGEISLDEFLHNVTNLFSKN